MNFIIKNFLRGLVIVVPAAMTIYVIYIAFLWIDRLLGLDIPGLGFVLTVTSIVLIGVLASNIVIRQILSVTERLFIRAPIVKILYTSIKDLIEAFVGDKKRFNHPVTVAFSGSGEVRAVGFVTREDLDFLGLPGYAAVYFPQSYNFAGNLIVVARHCITPLDLDSAKAMAFIVSAGISGTETAEG